MCTCLFTDHVSNAQVDLEGMAVGAVGGVVSLVFFGPDGKWCTMCVIFVALMMCTRPGYEHPAMLSCSLDFCTR